MQLNFRATNNAAEYEGLLAGLRVAVSQGVKRIIVNGDSEMVANQVHKYYKCSNFELSKYLAEVRKQEHRFYGFEVHHVYHKDNADADNLTRRASKREPTEPGMFLELLTNPSVKNSPNSDVESITDVGLGATTQNDKLVADIEMTIDWRTSLTKFLNSDKLPDDDMEAEKLSQQAKVYCIISDDLYKKAAKRVLLKCITSGDGKELLLDIHKGICGSHAGV